MHGWFNPRSSVIGAPTARPSWLDDTAILQGTQGGNIPFSNCLGDIPHLHAVDRGSLDPSTNMAPMPARVEGPKSKNSS